ncbi:MAG: hypothetical protein ACP5M5_00425 [Acidibrevibacterium sp.]|uniref:hypothetical protein n=1 Tax=Acidibrevibacterium sp. TaxID=2606776 RepID=UPI003CFD6D1A
MPQRTIGILLCVAIMMAAAAPARSQTAPSQAALGARTPESCGAVGDGRADDRAALQKCLDEGGIIRLDKRYNVASGGLTIPSGARVIGAWRPSGGWGDKWQGPSTIILNPAHPITMQTNTALSGVLVISRGVLPLLPVTTFRQIMALAAYLHQGAGVTAARITNRGAGCTAAPVMQVTGGAGRGFAARLTMKDGGLEAITIIDDGDQYPANPSVSFTGGGCKTPPAAEVTVSGGAGTGIVLAPGDDMYLENVDVLGFNVGISGNYAARVQGANVFVDADQGILLQNAYSNPVIYNWQAVPDLTPPGPERVTNPVTPITAIAADPHGRIRIGMTPGAIDFRDGDPVWIAGAEGVTIPQKPWNIVDYDAGRGTFSLAGSVFSGHWRQGTGTIVTNGFRRQGPGWWLAQSTGFDLTSPQVFGHDVGFEVATGASWVNVTNLGVDNEMRTRDATTSCILIDGGQWVTFSGGSCSSQGVAVRQVAVDPQGGTNTVAGVMLASNDNARAGSLVTALKGALAIVGGATQYGDIYVGPEMGHLMLATGGSHSTITYASPAAQAATTVSPASQFERGQPVAESRDDKGNVALRLDATPAGGAAWTLRADADRNAAFVDQSDKTTIWWANRYGFNLPVPLYGASAILPGGVSTSLVLDQRADAELATVGGARLPGGLLAAAVVIRRGAQRAAFTDVTDSAGAIAAAAGNAGVGQRWRTRIENTTTASETIAPGPGVTLIGKAKIPRGTWRDFDFTVTGHDAIAMRSVGGGTN